MPITRRDFMKQTAAASAIGVAGGSSSASGQTLITDAEAAKLKWSKAPCRFCGVGCGVSVGVKDGRVIATEADGRSEVNRVRELRQGLLPVQNHVWRRSPDDAFDADEERTL